MEKYAAGADEVTSQVTSLAASRADTFFNGATLLACPNALNAAKAANWDAVTFVSGTCISKTLMGIAGDDADGVLASTNIKDPLNPAFAEDEAMKEYKATVEAVRARRRRPRERHRRLRLDAGRAARRDPEEPRHARPGRP